MMVKVDSFQVVTENGQEFTVEGYRKMIAAGHMGNPNEHILGGLIELRTTEGYAVNNLGNGEYEIVNLQIKAKRK